jgi:hypothetical protein
MQERSETFGIVLNNIPLINLRNEFTRYYNALNEKDFTDQFKGEIKPVKTPYMMWFGMPDDLITLILQKVISGIESYLPGAVYSELGIRGRLKENIESIRNPFLLKGRGTVENYFHLLPGLISEEISLKKSDIALYKKTKAFYQEIRNPIFHGCQLEGQNIMGAKRVFEYLAEVYCWIDSWHKYET